MENLFHSLIFPICKWNEKARAIREIKTNGLLDQVYDICCIFILIVTIKLILKLKKG